MILGKAAMAQHVRAARNTMGSVPIGAREAPCPALRLPGLVFVEKGCRPSEGRSVRKDVETQWGVYGSRSW